MKFCNNTNFTLPIQSQRSRSVLEDGSRSLGLFWKEKNLRLITEEIRYELFIISCTKTEFNTRSVEQHSFTMKNKSTFMNYLIWL